MPCKLEYLENSISKESNIYYRKKCCLNVGGVKHQVLWENLERLPNSRLAKLKLAKSDEEILKFCDDFNRERNEFYFDRQADSFISILNFYRTGKLHIIEDICVMSFQEDLKYWEISELNLEICCQQKYYQKKQELLDEMEKELEIFKTTKTDEFKSCCPNMRSKIWNLVEYPKSSTIARVSESICISFYNHSDFLRLFHSFQYFSLFYRQFHLHLVLFQNFKNKKKLIQKILQTN
jgi:potassium voltage-gated channel Shab-related subfamily B protein 1